jgi:hypothetical protein
MVQDVNQYAESVISSRGQLVRGSSSGTREAYNLGSSGKVLQSDGSDPVWASVATADSILSARGQIIYGNAAGNGAALSPGTSGYFLKTQGAGADPVWAEVTSGAWSKIGTGNLSGGAASDLTITGMTTKKYLNIFFWGGFSSADELAIQMGDGSIDTGSNYSWTVTKNGANSTTATATSSDLMNSTSGSNIYCQFFMHNNTADLNQWGGIMHTGSDIYTFVGYWNDSDQIDQIKFFGSNSGNNLGANTIVNVYGAD